MVEKEGVIKKFGDGCEERKVGFMSWCGWGGMESGIMNCVSKDDKGVVMNGGSFGEGLVELVRLEEIGFSEIKLEDGKGLKGEDVGEYEGKG